MFNKIITGQLLENNMTYKINYDPQTTLVLGKYPTKLYGNEPKPNIEISDAEYKKIFGDGLFQTPCVIDGVIQEFVRPNSEILQEAKTLKLSQLESARKEFQYKNIELNGETYIASKIACDNLIGAINVMVDNNLVKTNWINANDKLIVLTLV